MFGLAQSSACLFKQFPGAASPKGVLSCTDSNWKTISEMQHWGVSRSCTSLPHIGSALWSLKRQSSPGRRIGDLEMHQ